jgi:hypothetical protein
MDISEWIAMVASIRCEEMWVLRWTVTETFRSMWKECSIVIPALVTMGCYLCWVQLCDGVGIARLLNATLVLPKFEVAAYWNESR